MPLKREGPVGGVFDFNFTDNDELDLAFCVVLFWSPLKASRGSF